MTTPQKRHYVRVPFDCEACLIDPAGLQRWETQLLDISLKGALISEPTSWAGQLGDHYLLEVLLSGHEITLTMEVSVAHSENGRVGFRCTHIDIDSASHLHRLMELNLADERELEREIHEMIGVN